MDEQPRPAVDPIDYCVGAALAAMAIWAWGHIGLALTPAAFVLVRHGRHNIAGTLAWAASWAPTYLLFAVETRLVRPMTDERAAALAVGVALLGALTAYMIADRGSLRRTFTGMEVRGKPLRRGAAFVYLAVMVVGPSAVITFGIFVGV